MDVLTQILSAIRTFGGEFGTPEKLAAVVTVALSMWKSSLFRPMWDKLGPYKVLVGPILSLLIAAFQVEGLTWSHLLLAFQTGAFSIALHELFDSIKVLPVVGEKYARFIEIVESLLLRPKK